jgi:hypothetical protein
MIWNIIDRRTRRYRGKCVNAIIEATRHDNTVRDSDEAPEMPIPIEVGRQFRSMPAGVASARGCHNLFMVRAFGSRRDLVR